MIDIDKLTANDQIQAMGKLSQGAAAWLVGVTGRTLRDHPEVPRGADGSYDAHDVIAWSRSRTKAVALSDDEVNQSINLCELILALFENEYIGHLVAASGFLDGLQSKYGESGLAVFMVELAKQFREQATRYRDDDLSRRKTPAELESYIKKQVEQLSLAYRTARGERALSVVQVCGDCSRWRKGAEWVKGDPPEGADTIESACPSCLE